MNQALRETTKALLGHVAEEEKKYYETSRKSADLLPMFDPSGLKAKIKELLDVDVEVTLEDAGRWERPRIEISAPNLIDKCGIMSHVFKLVTVISFSSSISEAKDDPEDIRAWASVNFHWQHKDGGTNGGEFFDAWYFFKTKEWKFRFPGDPVEEE